MMKIYSIYQDVIYQSYKFNQMTSNLGFGEKTRSKTNSETTQKRLNERLGGRPPLPLSLHLPKNPPDLINGPLSGLGFSPSPLIAGPLLSLPTGLTVIVVLVFGVSGMLPSPTSSILTSPPPPSRGSLLVLPSINPNGLVMG
jgi:hypothetical protein